MNWFLTLDQADQEFVKQLVHASGSLKQLAKVYQVSVNGSRILKSVSGISRGLF